MKAQLRIAVACVACAVVTLVLVLASPRRHISADTVPNRAGAITLRCGGSIDLSRVDWIAALDGTPYWAQRHDGAVYSVFGPAPGLVGALVMPGMDEGDVVDDTTLRARERLAAALLLAIATALLVLACAARASLVISAGAGLVCAGSFAGAATLGQGLWQATAALPLLMAAVAGIAWADRSRAARLLAPALLVAAVLVRPTIAPLVLGLGIAWCTVRPTWREWLIAAVLATAAAAPFVMWQWTVLGTLLPTGQLEANANVSEQVFVLSRAQVGFGVGGLLASPARGLLWFAPIAIVATFAALRRGETSSRLVAGGIVLQVVVMGVFHMWWGGICFGPRFLAEAVWVAIWLGTRVSLGPRWLTSIALVVTLVVGQAGLWAWRAEQWETRRNPDIDQSALWDFTDSPIIAIVASDADEQLLALDAPASPPRLECRSGRLRAIE